MKKMYENCQMDIYKVILLFFVELFKFVQKKCSLIYCSLIKVGKIASVI